MTGKPVRIDGAKRLLPIDQWSCNDWSLAKQVSGLRPYEMVEALRESEPDAILALIVVTERRRQQRRTVAYWKTRLMIRRQIRRLKKAAA